MLGVETTALCFEQSLRHDDDDNENRTAAKEIFST